VSLVDALIAAVAALPVALVVHELGHFVAAVALTGGRAVPTVHFGTASGAWGARVEAELAGKARTVAFLASGPIVSALFGAALLPFGGAEAIVGAVSVLFAFVCAFGSDGAGVLRALRSSSGNDERKPAR
jgi:hypothetical protein